MPTDYFFLLIFGFFSIFILNILVQYFLSNFEQKQPKTDLQNLWKKCKKDRKFFVGISLSSVISIIIITQKLGLTWQALMAIYFFYYMIALSFIDLRLQILPDILTKSLIAIGVILGLFDVFTDFMDSLLGALLGYFILWTINTVFRFVRNKEGMGYGDFKLLAAIGAWVGASQIMLVFVLSSFVGLFITTLTLKLSNQKLSQPAPFGPSLAITGSVVLIYGQEMLDYYYSLFAI